MEQEGRNGLCIVKGVAFALALSVLSAVVSACVFTIFNLPDRAAYPVNQALKILFAALGAAVFVRGEKGWLKGAAVGLGFFALSYFTFSAIGGDFSATWRIWVEGASTMFAGVVGGVIGVNLRR